MKTVDDVKKVAGLLSVESTDKKPKPRGHKPKHGVARTEIAAALGVGEQSIRNAEQHMQTAEAFPFMQGEEVAYIVSMNPAKLDSKVEPRATKVRIRAERKVGELIPVGQRSGQMLTAGDNGGAHRGKQRSSDGSSTLRDLGISYDQSAQWQRLAVIPKAQFEEILASPTMVPSTVLEAAFEGVGAIGGTCGGIAKKCVLYLIDNKTVIWPIRIPVSNQLRHNDATIDTDFGKIGALTIPSKSFQESVPHPRPTTRAGTTPPQLSRPPGG